MDGLVNNAFAIPPLTDLSEVDLDAIRAAFETNVLAALQLTRLFTPALAEHGGSVVMINSAVLRHSKRTFGAYKMAKAALLALAQSLPTELGPQGVRVNTIAPGYIWADNLKWYFDYLGEEARRARRSRSMTRPPPRSTSAGSPNRTRSPTPWCSCSLRSPAPSPASASTSTAASGTTDPEGPHR